MDLGCIIKLTCPQFLGLTNSSIALQSSATVGANISRNVSDDIRVHLAEAAASSVVSLESVETFRVPANVQTADKAW